MDGNLKAGSEKSQFFSNKSGLIFRVEYGEIYLSGLHHELNTRSRCVFKPMVGGGVENITPNLFILTPRMYNNTSI